MEYLLLSNTNCMISRTALSTDSLTSYPTEEGVSLIRKAYEGGINFYHISNGNTHLKEILGYAFYGMRKEIFISISSSVSDNISLQQEIITSLDITNSSYIDIFSIHNDSFVPKKDTKDGLYTTLLSAKADENVKSIGFSTSNIDLAQEALESSLYDIIIFDYALGKLSVEKLQNFIEECKKRDIGLIINYTTPISNETDFPLIFGFLRKSENLIPMWKIENQEDLQKILYFEGNPPLLSENYLDELKSLTDK